MIKELSVDFDVKQCCAALGEFAERVLPVQKAKPTRREKVNAELIKRIKDIFIPQQKPIWQPPESPRSCASRV